MSALQDAVQALYASRSIEVDGTPDEINESISRQNQRDAFVNAHGVDVSDSDLPEFDEKKAVNPSDPHKLTDAKTAMKFMLAGNAYFTIRSLKSGVRYTFRVAINKHDDQFCKFCRNTPCTCEPMWFVSMLTGSSNEHDYSYMGIVKGGFFKTTSKSRFGAQSQPVLAFNWLFAKLQAEHMPTTMEMWHEGRCGRCGRKLTVPESIEAGIGPECASRME